MTYEQIIQLRQDRYRLDDLRGQLDDAVSHLSPVDYARTIERCTELSSWLATLIADISRQLLSA